MVSKVLSLIKKVFTVELVPVKYRPMTQLFMLINLVVFILQILNPNITETYVYRYDVWYSYVTACFLHGGVGHLVGNMMFLAFIFPAIERRYGSLFLFVAYIVTGAFGSMLCAYWNPEMMGLGASGSIMGLMMIWIFHNLFTWRFLLIIPALMYFMKEGVFSGITLIFPDGIGHLAHYGSGLGSFLFIPWMVYKRVRK